MKFFPNAKVLVVGDVMVDEFVEGSVERISPEAPVPVFLEHDLTTVSIGGAGNVWANLKALGSAAEVVGVAGPGRLPEYPHLVHLEGRLTTMKRRYTCGGQHVFRIDRETTTPLTTEQADQVLERAVSLMFHKGKPLVNAVVLSDYAKGVVTSRVARAVITRARDRDNPIPVIVDTKRRKVSQFKGADVITPNLAELSRMTDMEIRSSLDVCKAAKVLREISGIASVVVTMGDKGLMLLAPDSNSGEFALGQPQEVSDVCGAGDTVVAVLAAEIGSGVDLRKACDIANVAAGTVVRHRGVVPVDPEELAAAIGPAVEKQVDAAA